MAAAVGKGRPAVIGAAPSAGPLRILVDGRVMQDRYHGIGRYTYELLRELSRRDAELVVLYSPDTAGSMSRADNPPHRPGDGFPGPAGVARSQWVLARAVLVLPA